MSQNNKILSSGLNSDRSVSSTSTMRQSTVFEAVKSKAVIKERVSIHENNEVIRVQTTSVQITVSPEAQLVIDRILKSAGHNDTTAIAMNYG